jgi:hypothetical protein
MVDLSKTIKINSEYNISYGKLLFATLIVAFQVLGIWCSENWEVTPAIFFALSTFFLTLGKRNPEERYLQELEEELKDNKDVIIDAEKELKSNKIKMFTLEEELKTSKLKIFN